MKISSEKSPILLIAHRGESCDAPENTRAAFDLAWQRGAAAIELDVYLTADGHLVCCHDATTERTSGKTTNLKIKDQTLAELQKIDFGSWHHPKFARETICTLDEVLTRMPTGKQVFVELKMGVESIPELKRVLKQAARPAEDVVVICFQIEVCRAAKRELPDHKVLWLVMQRQDEATRQWLPTAESIIATARDAGVDGVDIDGSQQCVTRELIQKIHDANLSCLAWTIDDSSRARQLIDAGIDAITTNRPQWLSQSLTTG